MSSPAPAALLPGEAKLAGPMFFLAVFFLAVLGGVIHRHKLPDPEAVAEAIEKADAPAQAAEDPIEKFFSTELLVQLGILAALLPVFWFEGGLRFWQGWSARGFWPAFRDFLLVALIPPLRLGQRSQGEERLIWLPLFGWRMVDRDLRRDLERAFGLPMIFIALLVLPLLVAEFFFSAQMRAFPWFQFVVEAGNALVWFAFALEFLVMLAVSNHKVRYCITHWIDLAIILLPLLHFLPIFRLLRLGQVLRLEQLSRMGRLYRMQGLAMKAWRAFLLLQLIQKLLGTSPHRQLEKLRELEQAKLEELDELREEIAILEDRIAHEGSTPDDVD